MENIELLKKFEEKERALELRAHQLARTRNETQRTTFVQFLEEISQLQENTKSAIKNKFPLSEFPQDQLQAILTEAIKNEEDMVNFLEQQLQQLSQSQKSNS